MTTKDLYNLCEFNANVDRQMCDELFGDTGEQVWRWITIDLVTAIGNMDGRQRRIVAKAINKKGNEYV